MKWQNLRQVYTGRGGVVVVYRGEGQGWVNELRDPAHWVAGCVVVDEAGQQTIAGNEAAGAVMWLPRQVRGESPLVF
ncbi:hypothetical protein ONZ60_23115 (plasmid) [Aeromonas salmonicida]|nr:hypothetical protein [Aeromonas salmonicida]ORJ13485.1 hypothetical protein A7D02_22235 [Aeromonas salmonicida]ORJ17807.1 hypothetical protein A7D03_21700 [Aeromonas salmonicida]WCH37992.1 hypothetical protein ONZ60_23115 [Aeromonas salmonicida]